jgi:hypothetical protein
MKHPTILATFLPLFFLTGCGDVKPIAKGQPAAGTIWEKSRFLAGSNTGSPIDKNSFVEVYSTLIIIISPDGTKRIVQIDQVSGLTLR